MFKKSDKIIARKDSPAYHVYQNRTLIVKHDQGECDVGVCYYINESSSDGWLAQYFCYDIPRYEPTNEVDFLNAFQYNFKDGV